MTGSPGRDRLPLQQSIGVILWVVFALLTTALTCGEIERRTEAVDPMYHEDELDVMVDYGATLQAQEATATARASGPPKPPASAGGEDVPDLPVEEGLPDSGAGGEASPADEGSAPPVTNFAGSWHSDATCDTADAPYRWQVDLQQDADGTVRGRISFHDCPGGGRVSYAVQGTATANSYITLDGNKESQRGDLGSGAPNDQTFSLTAGGAPEPNLAP